MSCEPANTPRAICLDKARWSAALASLRPRGRAWRHGGTDALPGSVMGQFFDWMGGAYADANARLCDLLAEMFCATRINSTPEWMRDFGLPDGCDPFADVCAKVSAVGDTTTDYAEAVLAGAGFIAEIAEAHVLIMSNGRVGCGGRAGQMRPLSEDGVLWTVTVSKASPALAGGATSQKALARNMRAGRKIGCGVDVSAVECLMRRIMPFHADLRIVLDDAPPPSSGDSSQNLLLFF